MGAIADHTGGFDEHLEAVVVTLMTGTNLEIEV